MLVAKFGASWLLSAISIATISTQGSAAPIPHRNSMALERFLRAYAHDPAIGADRSLRFMAARLPNSTITLAYVQGERWCGTGGCSLLILRPADRSFKVVTEVPTVWRPITMLNTSHHGLPDIGVWVQGGGIQPGYRAALSFDGKGYPQNPTLAAARRVAAGAGKVLISQNDPGVPLYR